MQLSRTSATANAKINGAALRQRRIVAGWSIKDLAKHVECSAAYISTLETAPNRTCSPALFARICDALRVPPADRGDLLQPTELDRSIA